MSTIQEFVKKYLGKRVDESGNDRGTHKCFPDSSTKGCHQCVSLVKFFCNDVYSTKIGIFGGGAADGFKNNNAFSSQKYEYIDYSKDFIPKRGDIIFFKKTKSNFYFGHIGIVLFANKDKILILEQNAGNGDGYGTGNNSIRINEKSYSNILGYHRYKNIDNILNKDYFDWIVYKKEIYLFKENININRETSAKTIFDFMSGGRTYSEKDYNLLRNQENATTRVRRKEVIYMIVAFLNKVKYNRIKYSFENMKNYGVWNGENEDIYITVPEFTIMLYKAKNL